MPSKRIAGVALAVLPLVQAVWEPPVFPSQLSTTSIMEEASYNISMLMRNQVNMGDQVGAVSDAVASLEEGAVADNADAIGALEDGAVADNTAAISDNADAITSLEDGAVADNADAIAALEDGAVADNAGAIADLEDAVAVASGEGALGTEGNPAKSCRHILQMGGAIHNGHYYITHDGNEDPYKAYCDMGRGGLELVGKLQHGISGNAADLWTGGGSNSDADVHINPFASGDHFITDKLEDFWNDAGGNFHTITAGAYVGNRRVNHFTFTADGTDSESWFGYDYLRDSSYNDLLTEDINFFSVAGDSTYGRTFFVNSNYGGCSVDAGWMVLDSAESDPCTWEQAHGSIDILYNPTQTKTECDDYLAADTFVFMIDYDVVYASCQDALYQSDFRARDGQYWIDHAGTTAKQIVYCDMEHGGYELVYKVVHGGRVSPKTDPDSGSSQNPDAYDLWTGATYDFPIEVSRNVDVHDETDSYGRGEHYASPFRHQAFSDSDIYVDDIEVRVITAEEVVKYVQFSGFEQDDDVDWFGKGYLMTSSWSDLLRGSTFNFFSIEGHGSVSRNWFINSNYGGCSVDSGWLCVVGRVDGCDWEERQYGTPDVMYACSSNDYDVCSVTLDSGGDCATKTTSDTYCFADLLAVFYKWSEA